MTPKLKQIALTIAAGVVTVGSAQLVVAAADKSEIPRPPVLSKDKPAPESSNKSGDSTTPAGQAQTAKITEQPELYWYDGQRKRVLEIDPSRVADFGTDSQGPAAQPKMIEQPAAPASKDQTASATTGDGVSPIFKDATSGQDAGALPGGVMVRTLRPLDSESADAVARAFGSSVVRPIGTPTSQDGSHDLWLFEAPAGLPALEMANRIHESGQVSSAAPNWWKFRQLK